MDISSAEEIVDNTPPEIVNKAKQSEVNLLHERSRKKYEQTYSIFLDWRKMKKINYFSENVLLTYFGELQTKYKSSTLWSIYSMLRSTLNLKNGVNIEQYSKLRALLKGKSEGYQAKKSKTSQIKEIDNFIRNAPDEVYLAMKVSLIMGVMGACRTCELKAIKIDYLEHLNNSVIVTVPITKTKTVRKGKYTIHEIGIIKFSGMSKQAATFLKIPDQHLYTGHSFRRSSATILIDAGADTTALKRYGGWKSSTVAEGYIDDLMKNKMETANKILSTINNNNPTTHTNNKNVMTNNKNLNVDINTPPASVINYGTININAVQENE